MSELNSQVLKLARNICAGKCGVDRTNAIIRELEVKYGDWDMPVELPDGTKMSPEQYLKSLSDTINSGVFSKEALVKMAEVSESIHTDRNKHRVSKQLLIGGVIILVIIIGIVVIVCIGGAK